MKLNETDVEIINKIIDETSFFGQLNYKVTTISKELGERFGDTLKVVYKSESRTLLFQYVLGKNNLSSSMFVFIECDQGRFSIDDYFNYIGEKEDSDNLMNREGKPYDIFIKNVSALVEGAYQKGLKNVIDGKEWIEVPFDWGDYK